MRPLDLALTFTTRHGQLTEITLRATWEVLPSNDQVELATDTAAILRQLLYHAFPATEPVEDVRLVPAARRFDPDRPADPLVLTRGSDPGGRAGQMLEGGLRIDLVTRRAGIGGQEIGLTCREFDLLAFLARHPWQVFTRTQLLQHVWELDYPGGTGTVSVYMHRLRSKLGQQARRLVTVRGVGYRLEAEPGEQLWATVAGSRHPAAPPVLMPGVSTSRAPSRDHQGNSVTSAAPCTTA